jgi:D-alanyl-D-alanine carboxypeptidase
MHDTHLTNPHGLDESGTYSSARDLALVATHILRASPELVAIAGTPTWQGDGHQLVNTNELLEHDPDVIAGKTGFTADAGYCLMEIARRGDRTIVAVLLGSTADDWYTDATTLLSYGFAVANTPGPDTRTTLNTSDSAALADTVSAPLSTSLSTYAVDDAALVHVAAARGPDQWRLLVVVLVGFAALSACFALWLAGGRQATTSTRRLRTDSAVPLPLQAHQRLDTQPLAWDGDDWFSMPISERTSGRSGWTAAFRSIGAGSTPSPRPGSGD